MLLFFTSHSFKFYPSKRYLETKTPPKLLQNLRVFSLVCVCVQVKTNSRDNIVI